MFECIRTPWFGASIKCCLRMKTWNWIWIWTDGHQMTPMTHQTTEMRMDYHSIPTIGSTMMAMAIMGLSDYGHVGFWTCGVVGPRMLYSPQHVAQDVL